MKQVLWLLLLFILAISACRKGVPLDNLAPETTIFVESINLTGENRLTSEVHVYWNGSDADGFISGFEFSFDQSIWIYSENRDSIFRFDLTGGTDTLDVHFWVRAIDGEGEKDPTPAYLKIPVKNSPPLILFDSVLTIPDTNLIVFSALWNVSDPDGDETLDSIFFRVNTGAWYGLTPDVNFLTLVPMAPGQTGSVTANVWKGIVPVLMSQTIDGYVLEDTNRVYVKAKDKAGAWSETDASNLFYVKRKTGNLLVIDNHGGTTVPTPEDVFLPIVNAVNAGGYDYLDMNDPAKQLPVPDPTFAFILNLYPKVFWYGDESTIGGAHYLGFFSSQIQSYLNNNGKLFITSKFPSTFDPESRVFEFSPMDSLSSSSGQARIAVDSLCIPGSAFNGIIDTLKCSAFLSGADPFYIKGNADILYTANITRIGGWSGPNIIAARTLNAGKTNLVFFSVELHALNGNPIALQNLFDYILNDAFNW